MREIDELMYNAMMQISATPGEDSAEEESKLIELHDSNNWLDACAPDFTLRLQTCVVSDLKSLIDDQMKLCKDDWLADSVIIGGAREAVSRVLNIFRAIESDSYQYLALSGFNLGALSAMEYCAMMYREVQEKWSREAVLDRVVTIAEMLFQRLTSSKKYSTVFTNTNSSLGESELKDLLTQFYRDGERIYTLFGIAFEYLDGVGKPAQAETHAQEKVGVSVKKMVLD